MFKVEIIRFNHADEFQEYKFSDHCFVYGKNTRGKTKSLMQSLSEMRMVKGIQMVPQKGWTTLSKRLLRMQMDIKILKDLGKEYC